MPEAPLLEDFQPEGNVTSLPDELPEGYYLENFRYLVCFVAETYTDLLTGPERDFVSTFLALPEDQQKLFVRLSNRRGDVFRLDKLQYDEVSDISGSISGLVDAEFAAMVIPPAETGCDLCTKAELASLEVLADFPKQTKKSDLVVALLDTECNPVEVLGLKVLQVAHQDTLALLQLMFFGNFHQSMTDFVLHELVAPYEKYRFSAESGPFDSRAQIDQLIELKLLSDLSYEVIERDQSGDEILGVVAAIGKRPTHTLLARRFDKTVNRLARQLERLQRDTDALAVYQLTESVPSRERRVRILVKIGQADAALALCLEIDADPGNEAERVFARSFGNRLATKQKHDLPFHPPIKAADVPHRNIKIANVDSRVEANAIHYFNSLEAGASRLHTVNPKSPAGGAFYVENALFRGLFGLCFWDIIFAPVKGVFFNPFQRGPADLFTGDFVASRESQIEQRLGELRAGQAHTIANETLQRKHGLANHFVYWGLFDKDLLQLSLSRIPAEHLALVFERMLTDLKANLSGLPDLILFTDDGYELIEIKGPGDKLQDNQIRWFGYFLSHQIPATVVNVEYLDAD